MMKILMITVYADNGYNNDNGDGNECDFVILDCGLGS